ncbi:MAG TPA: acetyl-CoA carboxylase carboxyltransferase subunit beta, partial [bacterium]|nr:acetyl-CoA carboxylase carboxyltransferase subunit beta [bacterium]
SSWKEVDTPLYATDPLDFVDSKTYKSRLQSAWEKSGMDDACRNIVGTISGRPTSASILDFFFMGGSMGAVVGEKITRGAERSLKERIPFITVSCSGGARMQEGFYSLMQLVKTSYACGKLRENGIPFISILTDPSTAGVMASFASLGDLIVAEEGALIGFAGPRVIAQTIGGELPKGFQRPEFCREHGLVDMVVSRKNMRETIHRVIGILYDSPSVAGRKKK